jgi:hypothetical protein
MKTIAMWLLFLVLFYLIIYLIFSFITLDLAWIVHVSRKVRGGIALFLIFVSAGVISETA